MTQNKAAVLAEKGARLSIQNRDVPTPGPHDILVKVAAIATNPVDWKVQAYGIFVQDYPFILGSDAAGTVEAVGEAVTHFKAGDRAAGYAASIATSKLDEGAFQSYVLLRDNASVKLPDHVSFEEGAILPMSIATTGVALFKYLGLAKQLGESKQKGGFLVWGAASSVGISAVQMAKSLGFEVYATASPSNADYIKKLGAKEVFNYRDSDVESKIVAAAQKDGQEIKYAYDAISEGGTFASNSKILEAFGGGKICTTLDWPTDLPKPSNVEVLRALAFLVIDQDKELGRYLFNDWLERALSDKSYIPSPTIQLVPGGIEGLQKALDLHKEGVSGKKLVVQVT